MTPLSNIRVLLVEDDADDALLTQELLREIPDRCFQVRWIADYENALEAILLGEFDVALLDYRLGSKTGLDLIRDTAGRVPRPLLLLTNQGDEDIDTAALEAGAMDYLPKGDITPSLMDRSIRYAIKAKETQMLLLNREHELRALLEGSPDITVRFDRSFRHTYVSPSVQNITGRAPEEFLGRTSWEMGLPERVCQQWDKVLNDCLTTGKSQELEFEFDRLGAKYAIHSRVLPEFSPDGSIVSILAFSRDITTLHEATRTNRRFAAAFDNLSVGVLITDPTEPEHPAVYTNPGFSSLTGYSVEETLGRNCRFLQGPDTDAQTVAEIRACMTNQQPFSGTLLNYKKDGTPFWNELVISPVFDQNGVLINFVGIQTDVTAQHQAVDSLHVLNETLHAIIASMPLALCTLNSEHRVTMWNPAAERIYGWSEQEILGQEYPLACGDPALEREYLSLFDSTMQGGQVRTGFETTRWRKDGRPVAVSIASAPLRDSAGTIHATLSMHTDITAHKQMEEQLRLAQRMEAVGRLAGGIAHDFNNLLMVISGNTQFALEELPEDSPIVADLAEVRSAADRAARLTQQLLAFSREQVLQPQPINLNDVVSNMESLLRRLIGKDVELAITLDSQLAVAEADPSQMDQVLMNLAINSRDAMPAGGLLTITTANATISEAEARRYQYPVAPGEYVALVVEDTGCGMSEQTLAHAFEPFFSTKGKAGTGLGLATVYGIVKQSGGFIWAESTIERGTTFRVYLPRAQRAADESRGGEIPALAAAPGAGTILVVEDENAVRGLVARVLTRAGYRVLEACDGEEGLRVATGHESTIDLVLTDVVMPRMSGREMAGRLKDLYPSVPVLFMSGYTDDALVHHGVRTSEAHFLQKPVEPEMLLAKLAMLLSPANSPLGC